MNTSFTPSPFGVKAFGTKMLSVGFTVMVIVAVSLQPLFRLKISVVVSKRLLISVSKQSPPWQKQEQRELQSSELQKIKVLS